MSLAKGVPCGTLDKAQAARQDLYDSTAYAGFDAAKQSAPNYFLCDGTADDVQMNLATTYVAALGGGSVELDRGAFNNVATVNVPLDVTLRGQGNDTIINYDAGGNCITVTGDNVKIRDLKIDIVAGAGAGGTRPNCIFADTRTNLEITKVWLVGDETVADDGSDIRQCGIIWDTVTFSRVALIRSNDHKRHGIFLSSSDDCTLTGNTIKGNTLYGIFLDSSSDNTLTGNTCQGNSFYGINLSSSSDNNTLTGNTCQGNYRVGIFLSSSDGCTLTGNTCQGNTYTGIDLHSSDGNTLTGNTCQGNTRYGIALSGADGCTLTGNTCSQNVWHGFWIDLSENNTIVGNTCNENDYGNTNTYDGICIEDDSDYNIVHSNTCNDNDRWGISIGIAADDCVGNWIKNNHLRGNTSGAFIDNGTDTKLATKIFQFTHVTGGTAAIQVASPVGCYVSDGGGTAIVWGQLPVDVQQVVRLKVWAVSKDAPVNAGGQMHAEFTFNAGASNANYATAGKSWNVANKDSEEADYVADDVVHWVLTDADTGDSEVSALVAGDSFELLAIYESAADPDGDTDAKFRVVEVEYV